MQKDIIIAGVGGQGILTIAGIIDFAALEMGLNIKQAEVHGMSQRGGAVQSHLRISDEPIYSDLIPKGEADMILSLEPMEALRYLPYLKEDGKIISAKDPYNNIPDYPDPEQLYGEIRSTAESVLVDIKTITCELGNPKAGNVVMLGAAAPYLDMPIDILEKTIHLMFERKGENVVDSNIRALHKGMELVG